MTSFRNTNTLSYRSRYLAEVKRMDAHIKSLGGDIDMTKIPEKWKDRSSVTDLLPDPTKYGDYMKVREIEGSPVEIVAIGDWSGIGDPGMGEGPALLVNANLIGGEKVWFIVSHQVLYRKLNDLRESVPFLATFAKVDKKRYYDVY